jgi:putative methyltransferase (TIGR04325 family)
VSNAAKAAARGLCPPLLWQFAHDLKRRFGPPPPPPHRTFVGPFATWSDAVARSDGWDADVITTKALAAALEVRDGVAEFEQDTIVCDRIHYSATILAFLALALSRGKGRLGVVDFGGGLATTWHQNRKVLRHLADTRVEWNIVERPVFATLGRQHFEREGVRFFASIAEAAAALGDDLPQAYLFSGSLQCVEHPQATLDAAIALGARVLAFDRLIVAPEAEDRIFVQQPDPAAYYAASYPTWCFSRSRFVERLTARGFTLVEDFSEDPGRPFDHCGMIFVKPC